MLYNTTAWTDPYDYIPQRFHTGSDVSETLKEPKPKEEFSETPGVPAAWVPFGMGRRRCPARNFALLELRVLVANLLRKYKWHLPEDSIHLKDGIKNGLSPLAFSYPFDMHVVFEQCREESD
jgi:cytochrome P450